MPKASQPRVCVGMISGAHGVRGLVKVKPFTEDPEGVTSYGPLSDESGLRSFRLELLSQAKGQWLARIEGVSDRTGADALRGTRLYVGRDLLPEPEEDEFYHADLIGLRVESPDGEPFGIVRAVHDFGAGPLIEIDRRPGAIMVPFTKATTPVVDLAAGRIVIDPPAGLLEPPGHRPEDEGPEKEGEA